MIPVARRTHCVRRAIYVRAVDKSRQIVCAVRTLA
jgi:hypothetical protein